MTNVYYSTSVRSAPSKSKEVVRHQINILKQHCKKVYNDHLGADDQMVLDMGHTNDFDIFKADMLYLENSDIVVADITTPSHGVGYMISQAVSLGKRVLCIYDTTICQKVSAMLGGNDKIVLRPYDSFESCERQIIKFLYPLKIMLCGKPGSGKGTVGKELVKEFGFLHISTGDLCREILKNDLDPLTSTLKCYVNEGLLVPPELMCEILSRRLSKHDCISNGFIIDGYPPSFEDTECFKKLGIKLDYIFYFDCSDETAVHRQLHRGQIAGCEARSTDLDKTKTRSRVELFNKKMNFEIVSQNWFPHVPSMLVNAELDFEEVYAQVSKTVRLSYEPPLVSTYFIQPVSESIVNSTKFHFHIDAPNYYSLLKIVKEVHERYNKACGQIKIYPIQSLHLGSQVQSEMKSVYNQMQNFREFDDANIEAFVTGKIGDTFNADFMDVVLEVCKSKNCMTELEEYVCEGTLNFKLEFTTKMFEVSPLNWTPSCKSIENPKLELHHAFNIPNTYPKMDLLAFEEILKKNGFNIGGLFIFKNREHWAYRTNEFNNNLSVDEAIIVLKQQALKLREILSEHGYDMSIEIGYSLEIVHGIWAFSGKKD